MKKPSRKTLVKKADSIFSKYIKERDQRCVNCGATSNLQCGHLFTRTNYSTRWDEINAYCQCAGCNMRHEYDAYPLTRFFITKYGIDSYDKLHQKHKIVGKKWHNSDLEELIENYTNKYNSVREHNYPL